MASLFNQQISQTYQGLLKTTGNGVLTGSLAQITDGSGNGSKLYLSTSKINFYNEYEFPTTDGSANQVLKTDGSGTLSWVAQSSGTVGISGSPTANQIAIWTNATTIKGMSAIEIDSNNKITLSQPNGSSSNTGSYNIGGGNITNHSGAHNTGFGLENLNVLTSGYFNTALGYRALKSVTTALENTAIGYSSFEFLATTTSHDKNTGVGVESGHRNNGLNNTFIGYRSGKGSTTPSNNTGGSNTALGYLSLNTLTSGNSNTAIGTLALEDNTTGLLNTCVGHSAGKEISTGSKNVILGSNDGTSIATSSNNIIISDGDGNARIQVDSSGNVGVGTTSPTDPLTVNGIIRVGTSTAHTKISTDGMFINGTSGVNHGYISSSGDLIFYTDNQGSNKMVIDGSGNVTIAGSISKGSGSFKIDHPIVSKKDTHYLVHSFIESPQANNIYRGKVDLVNGLAEINLDEVSQMTEGTFILLNTNIHCYTTNESDWDAVKGKVDGNILKIECQNSDSIACVSWLVIGERQDKHIKETNWTDENGKVIVEPLKS